MQTDRPSRLKKKSQQQEKVNDLQQQHNMFSAFLFAPCGGGATATYYKQ